MVAESWHVLGAAYVALKISVPTHIYKAECKNTKPSSAGDPFQDAKNRLFKS